VTNTGQPAFREIRYDVAGGTATMTLHRPDRLNAFTRTMAGELAAAARGPALKATTGRCGHW
jgi:enoyl-CoA hydratase/carnithine racemase